MRATLIRAGLLLLCGFGQLGCEHIGPKTILADRLPYNEAVGRTWQEQTLLNIVKLRYFDTPFFTDVTQIVSGYTLGEQVAPTLNITPGVSQPLPFNQRLAASLGLQTVYADRPTISYTPQVGSQFIRHLTTPITPVSILSLIQAGYPADVVLNLAVESINGIKNRSVAGGQIRPADPEFGQFVRLIRRTQLTGEAGIRVDVGKDKKEGAVLFFRRKKVDPELARELDAMRKVLGLNPDQHEFRVAFGATAMSPDELAILSRPVIRILSELATFVEVPDEHLARGIAPDLGDPGYDGEPPFRVFCCATKPCDPFVAVCYEHQWFWIDKRDVASKRTMAYLLVMLALADVTPKLPPPVLSITAN
jgi:hypothetical protein